MPYSSIPVCGVNGMGIAMIIGLPQAFLFHRYGILWQEYFRVLGCKTVASGETTREIFEEGSRCCTDECCMPAKIFIGHVHRLMEKSDVVFIPRFDNLGERNELCTQMLGIYDIVRNTFPNIALLNYNVQHTGGKSQRAGLIHLGRELGFSKHICENAYHHAAEAQREDKRLKRLEQHELLTSSNPKILIISQSYIIHDKYIGDPVCGIIREQGAVPVFSDWLDRTDCEQAGDEISPRLYWALNRESTGAAAKYGKHADGMILLTAFPCGACSLVNEMIIRKSTGVPVIQILLDGLQGDAGLRTRIESFIDIINTSERRAV